MRSNTNANMKLVSESDRYLESLNVRIQRLKKQSAAQKKKQLYASIIFLGLGAILAIIMAVIIIQSDNFTFTSPANSFSKAFHSLLNR